MSKEDLALLLKARDNANTDFDSKIRSLGFADLVSIREGADLMREQNRGKDLFLFYYSTYMYALVSIEISLRAN